jgi:hypothetical protein
MSRELGLIDDTMVWGYWRDGVWMPLPKVPMTMAGLGPPPFNVTRPDGREIEVVARLRTDLPAL